MSETPSPKTVVVDWRKFDPLQIRVLDEIARDILTGLKEAGVAQEKIREVTENLTFGVAAIIDGSRVMDLEGAPVRPILTFAVDDEGSRLIGAEGGSWMHEYAIGAVERLFENEEA